MIPLKVDLELTRAAIINAFLIMLNVLTFLYEVSLPAKAGQALIYTFGLIPSHTGMLFAPHGATLGQALLPMVTSMFLHGGWMHLLGNMLFLWVFGGAVEDAMGHFQYFIFYFVCGVGSAVAHTIFIWGAQVATLIPALFLFFTVRIPAFLMLGYWFFLQIFSGLASLGVGGQQGGVAWWAHVGGFLLGAVLVVGRKFR